MRVLINKLPITQIKIFLARILYKIVHLIYRDSRRVVKRNGIIYDIDLSEGIELSLFLFGNYQKHIYQNKYTGLSKDSIVFDIGANIGVMTLQFAKLVPLGKVYAFEPTHYAFSKLKRNLELNPELAERVIAVQSFVSDEVTTEPDITAYASWKVDGAAEEESNRVHGGSLKSTEGIGAVSLDYFGEKNELKRLDLIKIDTDGHEMEVLQGAKRIIKELNPPIIFEAGLYIIEGRNLSFLDYCKFFNAMQYSLFNSSNMKKIDEHNYRKHIPQKGTIDILAVPDWRVNGS